MCHVEYLHVQGAEPSVELVVVNRKGQRVQVPSLRGNVISHSASITDDLPADWSPTTTILGSDLTVVSIFKAASRWIAWMSSRLRCPSCSMASGSGAVLLPDISTSPSAWLAEVILVSAGVMGALRAANTLVARTLGARYG